MNTHGHCPRTWEETLRMNGITAVNFQTDSDAKRRKISDDTSLSCEEHPDGESVTRQEEALSTDINRIIARHDALATLTRASVFGEHDFSIDLQQALDATRKAQLMHDRIPQELRERYPTWQSLLTAIHEGRLTLDMTKPDPEPVSEKKDATKASEKSDT